MTESVPAGESMGEAEANVWLQERVVRIAERAFWDSFVENLLVCTLRAPLRGSLYSVSSMLKTAVIPPVQIS